jgi:hypothetical protein
MNAPEHKDFYEIWENAYRSTLDGFKVEEDQKSETIKNEWITRLPDVITMLCNRLDINKSG